MFDWSRHPERDQVWAVAERNKIGEERFRREHLCEFIVFDETLINSLKLAELSGVDPILKAGQVRYYRHIEGRSIVTGKQIGRAHV